VSTLGVLVLCALVAACGGGGGGGDAGVVCTLEARSSVALTVLDASGAPLPGVTVTYQVNGGPTQSQACESNGTCSIGFEVSGTFNLAAAKAGYITNTTAVTVNRDACHVLTERLTLTLRQSPGGA
jgi:hypothetical protein